MRYVILNILLSGIMFGIYLHDKDPFTGGAVAVIFLVTILMIGVFIKRDKI